MIATRRSVVLALLAGAAIALGAASTALADPPNPCTLIPGPTIASAFGTKAVPPSTDATTPTTSTCNYNQKLTVEIGTTALTNPAKPLKVVKLAGIPHGLYYTYPHTTQSQVTFLVGTAGSGTYVVISNYAKIKEAKLAKIASVLDKALA